MSIISQYSGQYINYESIHDSKQIWEFINQSKVYSNFHDYRTMAKQLIEYEKGRKLQGNKKKSICSTSLDYVALGYYE